MTNLENEIRNEIENIHVFLAGWFNGTVPQSDFDDVFLAQIDRNIIFIDPNGASFGYEQINMMRGAYGSNPDFRIQIRDVKLHRTWEDSMLVTYTEWQRNAQVSALSQNGRITTMILAKEESTEKPPFRWLHIQETWLPNEVVSAANYDF